MREMAHLGCRDRAILHCTHREGCTIEALPVLQPKVSFDIPGFTSSSGICLSTGDKLGTELSDVLRRSLEQS